MKRSLSLDDVTACICAAEAGSVRSAPVEDDDDDDDDDVDANDDASFMRNGFVLPRVAVASFCAPVTADLGPILPLTLPSLERLRSTLDLAMNPLPPLVPRFRPRADLDRASPPLWLANGPIRRFRRVAPLRAPDCEEPGRPASPRGMGGSERCISRHKL